MHSRQPGWRAPIRHGAAPSSPLGYVPCPAPSAMRLIRYCDRERLPGGARLWQRLARRAGFRGTLAVYGYGVGGRPGGAQRKAERTGVPDGVVLADYEPRLIRVWLPRTCQA